MSDSPLDLDLKFLPDWLKEPSDKNPYADFAGEVDRGPRRDFGRGPARPGGPRPQSRDPRGAGGSQGSQNRGPGPRGYQGGNRPAQGQGGAAPRGPRPQGQSAPAGPGRDNRERNRPPSRDNRDSRNQRDGRPGDSRERGGTGEISIPPREPSIPLHVEFIPEPSGIAALGKQIRSGHRAYPIYGLGRMFLNKPERHRVRITSNDPAHPIFQVGEGGPAFLSRSAAEREAFRLLKAKYYLEETVQVEAPKGNFKNVARCRLSGVLLGPTNHHGYQPALRRLFETRFSRRMDFNDFLRQIEVVSDPAVVEQWKAQCSSTTVFRTTQEAEPLEFKSAQEVDKHFVETYLQAAILACKTVEVSGVASREVSDRNIRDSIRNAWEKERGFPAQIVNQIRPHFLEIGLHIWKHRKRILFVSTVRPIRFGADSHNISEHIVNILEVIAATPRCSRAEISNQLLKPHEAEAEFPKLKAALASDLHWLIQSGHVIEFHDGVLDLPLAPKDLANEPQAVEAEPAAAPQRPRAEKPKTDPLPPKPVQQDPAETTSADSATESVEAVESDVAICESQAPAVSETVSEQPAEPAKAPADPADPTQP